MKKPARSEIKTTGSRTTRSRILSNSVYGVGSYAIIGPLSLIVTTFVVHRIGVGAYGVWATMTTLLGFSSLLDLGITAPVVKYVAEYAALDDKEQVNGLVNTATVFYAALSAVFLAGMILASSWILTHVFHASAADTSLRALYLAVLMSFAASFSFSAYQSLLVGLQRVDVTVMLRLGAYLVNYLFTVITVFLGFGVNGLAMSWVIMTLLGIASTLVMAKRIFPPMTVNPFLFRKAILRKILGFSTKVQITTLTLVLSDQVDPTLIAYNLGHTMVGYWSLAFRAASIIDGISHALMAGILPAASDLSALQQTARLRRLYLRASRYLAIVDFGLCAGLGGLAWLLVWAWLGSGYDRTVTTLIIILIGYIIWLPSQAATSILYGLGRPGIRMRADVAFLLIHAPLSVLLIWRFGYFGTVVGTACALGITRMYVYVAGARALGVEPRTLLRESFLRPALGALLVLVVAAGPHLIGVPPSFPLLAAEVVIAPVLYGAYSFSVSLDREDRDLVRSLIMQVRSRLGAVIAV